MEICAVSFSMPGLMKIPKPTEALSTSRTTWTWIESSYGLSLLIHTSRKFF
jgi:hypothetical protein